jgi:hypothetical protein
MSDPDNKASPGKFKVVAFANYGGPYWGSAFLGEYDSLAEARAVVEQQAASNREGNVEISPISYSIYDERGNSC